MVRKITNILELYDALSQVGAEYGSVRERVMDDIRSEDVITLKLVSGLWMEIDWGRYPEILVGVPITDGIDFESTAYSILPVNDRRKTVSNIIIYKDIILLSVATNNIIIVELSEGYLQLSGRIYYTNKYGGLLRIETRIGANVEAGIMYLNNPTTLTTMCSVTTVMQRLFTGFSTASRHRIYTARTTDALYPQSGVLL